MLLSSQKSTFVGVILGASLRVGPKDSEGWPVGIVDELGLKDSVGGMVGIFKATTINSNYGTCPVLDKRQP